MIKHSWWLAQEIRAAICLRPKDVCFAATAVAWHHSYETQGKVSSQTLRTSTDHDLL